MIRHGEAEANVTRTMAGSLDSPLTERGREQALAVQNVAKQLKIKPKGIIHSPLSRARDTAHIINEALNIPISADPDFAELYAGDWEGQPYEICSAILEGWVDIPNGEPCETFFKRIKMATAKALQQDEPVMIVAHGGVFRAFLQLYGIDKHGVKNCTLYEFKPKEQDRKESFPWTVWRYDIEQEIIRRSVNLYNHPASEIA